MYRETAPDHTKSNFGEHSGLDKFTKKSQKGRKNDQCGIYAVFSVGVQPLSFEKDHHFKMETKPTRLHECSNKALFIYCASALTVSAVLFIRFYSDTGTYMNVLAILQTVSTSGRNAPRSTIDQSHASLQSTSTFSSFSSKTMPYERKDEALCRTNVNYMDDRHNFEDRTSALSEEKGTSKKVVGVIPTIKVISSYSCRAELIAKQMEHGALCEHKSKERASSAAALNGDRHASEKANTVVYHICIQAQSQIVSNMRSSEVVARSDLESCKAWKKLDKPPGSQNISESVVMVSDVRNEAPWETWSLMC